MSKSRFAMVVLSLSFITPVSVASDNRTPATVRNGLHDFDFLLGTWNIHLKRLIHPLSNSDAWVEFDGRVMCRSLWDGRGQIEEFIVDNEKQNIHIQGITVRLYNSTTGEWSEYWANARNGSMDPLPQVGRFTADRGEFFGQDKFEGRSIYVKYTWTAMATKSPHFEQGYSIDGGKTWEVNWITEQSRVSDEAADSGKRG
jgi:hypothetical protein